MDYLNKLETITDLLRVDMINTLKEWIKIPSVKSTPRQGAPFGTEVRRALDVALSDCRRLGFAVEEFDGYAAHVDLGEGQDEDALAILAHLDVVPEGDGWNYPPYGAVIENGRMYGRGTSDDKGPAVAALYAMKAVQLAGIPLKRKVRLILGCDEESGWQDIAYYKTKATMPRSGFSPDASYPVINLEKGICHLFVHGKLSTEGLQVLELSNGERPNVVPGKASALVLGNADTCKAAKEAAEKFGFPLTASIEGDHIRLTAIGINGHAAYPESARNAIGEILLVLRELGVQGALKTLADKIGMDYTGKELRINVSDGMSGPLTCNTGIIRTEGNVVHASLDIRYPLLASPDMILSNIRAALSGFDIEVTEIKAPHYVSDNSELVQNLLDAYSEVTGYERKCVSTGGGTYARALEEGVAFGASFPKDEDLAHQANEYADLDGLYKNMKIFTLAIVKLAAKA